MLDEHGEVVNVLSLRRIAAFIATENSFWQLHLCRPILAGPISNWGCTSSFVTYYITIMISIGEHSSSFIME